MRVCLGRFFYITRHNKLKFHSREMSEIERHNLIEALEKSNGNKSEAARYLGLKRSTFFNKLKKHGLLDTTTRVKT